MIARRHASPMAVRGRLVAMVAILGSLVAAPSTAAPSVALYVAPGGSDRASCSVSAPCATMNRAFQLAAAGQQVLLKPGTYGDQLIGPSARPQSKAVVFAPVKGADVSVGEVRVNGAQDIEFRGLALADYVVLPGSARVTFRNVTTKFFFIRSASAVSILGGSVGGEADAISPTIGSAYRSTVPAQNILIADVDFHDVTRANKPSEHVECLFVQSVDGLKLQRSRFHNCDVFDVYVHKIDVGPPPTNVLFEDNFFDTATSGGFYSVYVRSDPGVVLRSLILRHNSFAQSFHFDVGDYQSVDVVGNVSPLSNCVAGITYSYNVFNRASCGRGDRRAPLGFVNAGAFDLHLTRGAAALGLDSSRDGAPRDIDGNVRPRRSPFDAGAAQRETALVVPGRSIGAVSLGMARSAVTAFYGSAGLHSVAFAPGAASVRLARYPVHGRMLWVAYDTQNSVVGVGTTSGYYSTASGLGVGTRPGRSAGARWLACPALYRLAGRVPTDFVTRGRKSNSPVSAVSILLPRYRGSPGCKH